MKTQIATSCFVIAALLAPIASHGADTDTNRSAATTFVKDSVITTKIKAKLAQEKVSSLGDIKVDTDNAGVVFLSGDVSSKEDADKAVAIAQGTEGVKSVKNSIQVTKEKM